MTKTISKTNFCTKMWFSKSVKIRFFGNFFFRIVHWHMKNRNAILAFFMKIQKWFLQKFGILDFINRGHTSLPQAGLRPAGLKPTWGKGLLNLGLWWNSCSIWFPKPSQMYYISRGETGLQQRCTAVHTRCTHGAHFWEAPFQNREFQGRLPQRCTVPT